MTISLISGNMIERFKNLRLNLKVMQRDVYLTIEETDVVKGKKPEQTNFLASKLYVPSEKIPQLEAIIGDVSREGWIANNNPNNVSTSQNPIYAMPTCAQGYNRFVQEIQQQGIDLTFFLMYRNGEVVTSSSLEGFDNYTELGVFILKEKDNQNRPEIDTFFFRPEQYATIPTRNLESDPLMGQLKSKLPIK